MADKDKKVVNTEEQNRAVNREDKDYKEENSKEPQSDKTASRPEEVDIPDGGSEVERPHRIEGDDASKIERKIPNM